MVQRKVPNKLGIQADHDKSEKRFSSLKTSSHFLDGKHRGADLKKKKMKKARSIKLSDVESLRSSPLRKDLSQPGRPPPQPLNVPSTAASPQKQPLTRTTYGSPNYMKPTGCSHARKEQSQASIRSSPPIFSDSKKQNRKNSGSSKLSSASSKPERSLARTSGLKLVRTLMKSPSFKPARAFCADVNVQRATCSSTLKDTKFPDYLTISPGGTEAEGTSIMKVCLYTYCSLNGHHHSPVPPVKRFLSARRRSLKTQKMMKLQALSPRGAKRCNDGIKEIDLQKMLFDENEKIAEKEAALDFFVEIYATNEEDGTEAIGRKAGADFVGEQEVYEGPAFPNDASDEAETENYASSLVVENKKFTRLKKSDIFGNNTGEPDNMEVENNSEPEATKNFNTANNSISPGMKRKFSEAASNFDQELPNTYNYWKRIKCKKLNMDGKEQRKFNPREPNYLPLVPDPKPEKVDLRHQIIDDKKNTDEWMLDYALQQAVTKLGPARKKKVALLVAAFETVMPAPKVEKHLRHTSTGFSHARPMQACS